MSGILKGIAVLVAVTAAIALGLDTARAAAEGVEVSWDGKGEIQLTPDGQGEFSLSLRLHGNVVVRGKQFQATAERLIYNMAKKVVSLEAAKSGEVRLSMQMPDDGPTMELAARKIVVSLSDGRITLDGAGLLSAPGKKQTPHRESETADTP
jgi:hypothetical protein